MEESRLKRISSAFGPLFTPRSRRRTILVLFVAFVIFAVGATLRLADHNPNDSVTTIYVLAIVYVAAELGVLPGVLCAAIATVLFLDYVAIRHLDVDELGYISRIFGFFVPAVVIGVLATRLRTARDKARQDEARTAALIAASDDAIVSSTLDGEVIAWNPGAERLYGYASDEAIGMSIFDLQLRLPFETEILEGVRTGKSYDDLDIEQRGKNGRLVDVSMSVFPLRDGDGGVVAATSITRDVSGRKRAARYLQAQLRAAEELASATQADRAGELILPILGDAGGWSAAVYWSAAADAPRSLRCEARWVNTEQHGVPLPADQGSTAELSGALDRPVWFSSLGEASSPALRSAEGRFAMSLWLPLAMGGEAIGAVELLDRRARENDPELTAAMFAIATQAAERIAHWRVAQSAERAKDEFFALVSHELRTPLTSIIGYADLLADAEAGKLTEEGRRYLEVVRRNAQRQLRLVGDLLLLVRIEEGSFDVEHGSADLEEIVDQAVEANRPVAAKRHITLASESSHVPACVGDSHRLMQVVDNLLTNAIKFTPEEGRVDVRLSSQNGTATIEVEDTGVGIPQADLSHLFERLYRASSASASQVPGLGLGLTIAKAIVDAHGGTIGVESEEGRGTRFRVELPLEGALS